ncbi:MAG: hypothetical protein IT384_04535 [Deltaproteobacteria bacterium]|nr:hypothetical protein [Deltaproteobacteria bacterium]
MGSRIPGSLSRIPGSGSGRSAGGSGGALEFRTADILELDRNTSGHITVADLPPSGRLVLNGRASSGANVRILFGADNLGLAARIFEYAKHHQVDGVVAVPAELLSEGPTGRALLACDSYEASLRRVDPAHLFDTLLAHVDPKIHVFQGGLRGAGAEPAVYPIVNEAGAIELRPASYDGKKLYVYVPADEEAAIAELQRVKGAKPEYQAIEVVPLAREESRSFTQRMVLRFDRPGVLWCSTRSAAVPELEDDAYLVPGARFGIEAYYHDARINAPGARSTIEALIADQAAGRVTGAASEVADPGRREEAERVLSAIRGTVNLFVNQLRALGKVLNGNHTVYLGRSQPPCLTTCIREVDRAWSALHPDDPGQAALRARWVAWATDAAIQEYREVWTRPPRLDPTTGLSRYVDEAPSQAPEELSGHYQGLDWKPDDLKADAAIREHGWDSHVGALALVGPERGEIRQHRLLPVCLNSLLYRYERDLAELCRQQRRTADAEDFERRAATRKDTMNRLMWSEEHALFTDLLEVPGAAPRHNGYEDLRAFAPLWAGVVEPGSRRAQRMVERIDDFMRKGGPAAATRAAWEEARALNPDYVERCQWGHADLGWPIATYETAEALRAAGYTDKADEIAYRWCWAVQRLMEQQGGLQYSAAGGFEAPILEKMDVTHVRAGGVANMGYGNQGAGDEGEGGGFRWGYDAFKLLARGLPERLRALLGRGTDPDLVFRSERLSSLGGP